MWHNMLIDGQSVDSKVAWRIHRLSGSQGLDQVLKRLELVIRDHLQPATGKFSNGLVAALAVQLVVGRWDSWTSFNTFEKAVGGVHPATSMFESAVRSCGSCLQGPSSNLASPGSSPS